MGLLSGSCQDRHVSASAAQKAPRTCCSILVLAVLPSFIGDHSTGHSSYQLASRSPEIVGTGCATLQLLLRSPPGQQPSAPLIGFPSPMDRRWAARAAVASALAASTEAAVIVEPSRSCVESCRSLSARVLCKRWCPVSWSEYDQPCMLLCISPCCSSHCSSDSASSTAAATAAAMLPV